jgi:hypothetical protein
MSFTSHDSPSSKRNEISAPNTPTTTLPASPAGKEASVEVGNSTFIIRYRHSPSASRRDQSKLTPQKPSSIAITRRGSFDLTPGFDDVADIPMRANQIATADEIDQCEQIISTEDEIRAIPKKGEEQNNIPSNAELLRKLEESHHEILASMEQQETVEASKKVERTATFSKIPDHPALGNMERYRSWLTGISPRRLDSPESPQKQENSDGSDDHSTDKASVTDGLKSLWDETTKNIESMNRVLSSCALDAFRTEKSNNYDDFTYPAGYQMNAPLKDSWLEVPDKHGEDISLLSNPKEISSGQSHMGASELGEVPVLEKILEPTESESVPNEVDGIVQENSKSRYNLYNRWL